MNKQEALASDEQIPVGDIVTSVARNSQADTYALPRKGDDAVYRFIHKLGVGAIMIVAGLIGWIALTTYQTTLEMVINRTSIEHLKEAVRELKGEIRELKGEIRELKGEMNRRLTKLEEASASTALNIERIEGYLLRLLEKEE